MQCWYCEWLCRKQRLDTAGTVGTLRSAIAVLWSDKPSATVGVWMFLQEERVIKMSSQCPCMCVGKLTCCYVSNIQDIIKRGSCCRWCIQMKINIANNVKFCVHGCNIFPKILELFWKVSWVTRRAINTNEKPTEARIWYVNTHIFKAGIVRAGVRVYVE